MSLAETVTITREFGFDMGHCLPDHLGGCYRPHGHRYRCEVTVAGDVVHLPGDPERGMVIDFGRMKDAITTEVVDRLDHRFVMSRDDQRAPAVMAAFDGSTLGGVLLVDGPPTAEYLAQLIAVWLGDALPVDVVRVDLWETPNCRATWKR